MSVSLSSYFALITGACGNDARGRVGAVMLVSAIYGCKDWNVLFATDL